MACEGCQRRREKLRKLLAMAQQRFDALLRPAQPKPLETRTVNPNPDPLQDLPTKSEENT